MSDLRRDALSLASHPDRFVERHIGPRPADVSAMLETLGYETMEALVDTAVPQKIRLEGRLDLPGAISEAELLQPHA